MLEAYMNLVPMKHLECFLELCTICMLVIRQLLLLSNKKLTNNIIPDIVLM